MRAVLGFFLALPLVSNLAADPIATYIFTGTASGTVGGAAFSDSTLTVTATGDVAGIVSCGASCFVVNIPTGSAVISISGSGAGTFSVPTYVFDNQTAFGGSVGFGFGSDDIQVHDADLGSTVFSTYSLATAIGPIGFVTDPSTADWVNLPTTLGNTTVTSYTHVSFQALVAEPRAVIIVPTLLLGIVWLGAARLSNRRRGSAHLVV